VSAEILKRIQACASARAALLRYAGGWPPIAW